MNKKQLMEILSDPVYPDNMEVMISGRKSENVSDVKYVCLDYAKFYEDRQITNYFPEEFILISGQ